jgi:hypothetical protein
VSAEPNEWLRSRLLERISALDPNRDWAMLYALGGLVQAHLDEHQDGSVRAPFAAEVHFTAAGAPEHLIHRSTVLVHRDEVVPNTYAVKNAHLIRQAGTWVEALLSGVEYVEAIGH